MNHILNLTIKNCGEYIVPITPSLPFDEIVVRKRFQFTGDLNRVREILAVHEEYVLVKTLGCSEDLPYYKCHYSYLKANETTIEELK